jgi:hypothetical protein
MPHAVYAPLMVVALTVSRNDEWLEFSANIGSISHDIYHPEYHANDSWKRSLSHHISCHHEK